MNAHDIINQTAQRYLECKSYLDKGFVDFVDIDGNRETIYFRTHFTRPKLLRFDWQDYGPKRGKSSTYSSLIWNGQKSTLMDRWEGIVEEKSLLMSVANATGCSAGSAIIVLPLLIESLMSEPGMLKGHLLMGLVDSTVEKKKVDGSIGHLVTGRYFNDDLVTFCISESDYTIRRAERKAASENDVNSYNYSTVKFDQDISAEIFEQQTEIDPQSSE